MKILSFFSRMTAAVLSAAVLLGAALPVHADENCAHDPGRDVQTQGVGNPFHFGERNTPADASEAEIRAINHAMSVQEVKYALYKEIDEHWELIKTRTGQTEREKVYALFLGVGTRESTLGGNGDGADIETAFSEGFGVSSAHAYGTLQTAVTAFADADPLFMKEEDVPEMYQYSLSPSNFYDAIISDHMGVRKIMHFCVVGMTEEGLEGYQVVRGALKGFNTGWATYTGENDGYYANYPDEIISLARWYYEEGHLYDNVFTWTGDARVDAYRQGNVWDWWDAGEPSLAPVSDGAEPEPHEPEKMPKGDVNLNGEIDVLDVVALQRYLLLLEPMTPDQLEQADVTEDGEVDVFDLALLKRIVAQRQ